MPGLLLDGTFLVDFRRETLSGNPGPATVFARANRDRASISVVTLAEFLEGERDARDALQWIGRFGPPLPLTKPVAEVAGALQRRLRQRGKRLGENDAWQAALGLHHGLIVVSRDNRFSPVPGLRSKQHAPPTKPR